MDSNFYPLNIWGQIKLCWENNSQQRQALLWSNLDNFYHAYGEWLWNTFTILVEGGGGEEEFGWIFIISRSYKKLLFIIIQLKEYTQECYVGQRMTLVGVGKFELEIASYDQTLYGAQSA